MTVVVHSFVTDSSLLDCCDLVLFFCCGLCVCLCVCVFHLVLAGKQPFGILRWFQLFCFFHLVSAVCLTIREAIFCLPQAFVVCSFFLCHGNLWSVLSFFATSIYVQSLSFTTFSAVGIRVRLFVFALLALVSGYQCISQFFCLFFCFVLSCCALAARQLHPWRIELEFFPSRFPVDSPTNSALKQTPFNEQSKMATTLTPQTDVTS